MRTIGISLALASLICAPALSQIPSLSEQLQRWEQTPEDPGMKPVCVNDLRWATEIVNRKNHGATVADLLRWAEQESEKAIAQMPSEPLIGTGAEDNLMVYIRRSYYDKPIYSTMRGGFVHWVYHSCLTGKPLYEQKSTAHL